MKKKSNNIIFTKCHEKSPTVTLNKKEIPTIESGKYLDMHLERGLTWRTHTE